MCTQARPACRMGPDTAFKSCTQRCQQSGKAQQNLVCGVALKMTHLHHAGGSAQAPATGRPQQQAPAATGSAAVGQQPPSTEPDTAAGRPASAGAPAAPQQRRPQGPQQAPAANGQGQHRAHRTNGSAAGAQPASPVAPQLFLPQQAQRAAQQQQQAPLKRPAAAPAPGGAPSPTRRPSTPPLKNAAPTPEPDYAAAFESAAKAIPLAGKPRRRRTSGSLLGGAGDTSHARAPSKSKKAALARKDAVSPQVQHRRRVAALPADPAPGWLLPCAATPAQAAAAAKPW